ncbi:unnamed protein product, partial [Heterosigma akashiwo]
SQSQSQQPITTEEDGLEQEGQVQVPGAEEAATQPNPCSLRSSCDRCLVKKVKCDKIKPCCSRCQRKNGGHCKYSNKKKPGRRKRTAAEREEELDEHNRLRAILLSESGP